MSILKTAALKHSSLSFCVSGIGNVECESKSDFIFGFRKLEMICFSILSLMAHSVFKIIADYSSEELEVLLDLLKVPELRALCRTFRIPSTTQPKPKMIEALLEYGKSQQTISGIKRGDSTSLIKSRYAVVY
jgi:hypothetical protein